jgi:hypothetical protein
MLSTAATDDVASQGNGAEMHDTIQGLRADPDEEAKSFAPVDSSTASATDTNRWSFVFGQTAIAPDTIDGSAIRNLVSNW